MNPAYIAGFFDGEGCVGASCKSKTGLPHLQLTLSQKNPEVLYIIQKYLGMGRIQKKRSGQHVLRFCHRTEIRRFIRIIYPHAHVKRQQLKVAYLLANTIGTDNLDGRWAYYHELQQLKH